MIVFDALEASYIDILLEYRIVSYVLHWCPLTMAQGSQGGRPSVSVVGCLLVEVDAEQVQTLAPTRALWQIAGWGLPSLDSAAKL